MIVAVLAGVGITLMQGKIDSAKWSEANAAAGTIRTAVSSYVAIEQITQARADLVGKKLDDVSTQAALGCTDSDLTGTYFVPSDYEITAISNNGFATIEVTASQGKAPQGTKTLDADGSWQ